MSESVRKIEIVLVKNSGIVVAVAIKVDAATSLTKIFDIKIIRNI